MAVLFDKLYSATDNPERECPCKWNKYPDKKPELVFLKNTMSAWFVCLPTFGGAPLLLRIIERVPGEVRIVGREPHQDGFDEDVIRLWMPIPPDENGNVY